MSAELNTRLVRFDLARAHAEKAMSYLFDAEVHGAALFPGEAGLARLVDDLAQHESPLRARSSAKASAGTGAGALGYRAHQPHEYCESRFGSA